MIARRFVDGSLTVQAGGNDLTFPHHDLGSGHSWALSARPHAKHYAHTGMVGLDGHKMSKSRGNTIEIRMSADQTAKLIKKAKTDSQRTITYDPSERPEVSNLLMLASLCNGRDPRQLAEEIGDGGAGKLKALVTEAINDYFAPIRQRREELAANEDYLLQVLHAGNDKANQVASETLDNVRKAMKMDY